jgi:hypothetical protein
MTAIEKPPGLLSRRVTFARRSAALGPVTVHNEQSEP